MELAGNDFRQLNAAIGETVLSLGIYTNGNSLLYCLVLLSFRIHGNKHRQPIHALSSEDVRRVVLFIENYSEDHAILLPDHIPGYNRFDLKLLPSSTTKLSIWKSYAESVGHFGERVAGYRSFQKIWSKYLPQVLITKPMSDLCWTCQQNNSLILRSSNKCEEEKSAVRTCFIVTLKIHVQTQLYKDN